MTVSQVWRLTVFFSSGSVGEFESLSLDSILKLIHDTAHTLLDGDATRYEIQVIPTLHTDLEGGEVGIGPVH